MATLILTTVGSVIAGPVGAAIGGLFGNTIDRGLLRPAPRQGPRLNELAVQTSSYGSEIPLLFGTIRVAGTVIWATDLIESSATEGRSKNNPGTVRYSYSVSFAVLLSARPIAGVRRIWADGKLLRGAAGDFKSPTRFRLHRGDADQDADPLIASDKGAVRTPAHRGHAYAVFEQFELADYGNRIPSLTFEVEADAIRDPGTIARMASGQAVRPEAAMAPPLNGFSAHGGSKRAVIEMLAEASGAWFAEGDDGAVTMRADGAVERTIVDRAVATGTSGGARATRSIAAADSAPRSITISHYDADRDYQAGLQRASRPGAGTRERRMDLPAVMAADSAKAVATAMLARADAARQRRRVTLGWEALDIAPGSRIAIEGEPGRWRVSGATVENMFVALDLVPIARSSASARAASGEAARAPDRRHGATVMVAAEIPPIDDIRLTSPRIVVVAGGEQPGWRRASLLASDDGGSSWRVAGAIETPGIVGTVLIPPGAVAWAIEDRSNMIEVQLAHDAMMPGSADAIRLDRGANLALVGDELIQFGDAEPLRGGRWRLGRLWRGRRGTEWAMAAHRAGERFAMLDPGSVVTLAMPLSAIGSTVMLAAQGIDDVSITPVTVRVDGSSVLPPAPVHLRRDTDGADVRLRWVRRSRVGWQWIDGGDVPLGEERERYRLTGIGGEVVETATPGWSGAATGAIAVAQIGDAGASRETITGQE